MTHTLIALYLNVSGACLHAVLQLVGEDRVQSIRYTHTHTHFPSALSWLYDGWDREHRVLHQHKCTGRGSARAALRGSVSLRALYCRSFYTLLREARVISYADSHHCSFYHADTFMHMHSYLEIHFSSSSSSNTKLIPFLGKRAIVNSSAATPTVSKSPFYWRLFIFKQFSTHVRGGGGVVGRNVSRATMKECGFITFSSSSCICFLQGISVPACSWHFSSSSSPVSLWPRSAINPQAPGVVSPALSDCKRSWHHHCGTHPANSSLGIVL